MLLRNLGFIALLLAMTVGLNACYAPPPRHTVVYHEGAPPANYGGPPPANSGGPPPANYGSSGHYCQACGTVRGIDQVQMRQGNSGGGAVLGAIIGGVIGNQFGGVAGKQLRQQRASSVAPWSAIPSRKITPVPLPVMRGAIGSNWMMVAGLT